MKPVLVVWEDAVSDDSWVDSDDRDDLDPHQIHSIGWLLHENANRILIALSLDNTRNGASQRLAIPKAWIQKIVHLPELENL